MKKSEFIYALREKLSGLPVNDAEDRLRFYGEMIDDTVEEGMTEDEAVASIGSIDRLYAQIISEIPLHRIIADRIRPARRPSGAKIAVVAATSPIWITLAVSALALTISLFAAVLSVVVSLWAVFISVAVSSPLSMLLGVMNICNDSTPFGVALIACGLILAGLSVFVFYGTKYATKGTAILTKTLTVGIKRKLVG